MTPVELNCEISHVSSKKLCYNACLCEAHRKKNRIKMVVPEVVETRDMIKFCINNNEKFRSFKSKENIHKKEVGPYRGFGY